MSTKKFLLKYLQNKIKKEILKNIVFLETRLEMADDKIKINKNQARRKRRETERNVLPQSENKKFELQVPELNEKLAILKDSIIEIQNKLDIETQNLTNIQQKIRVIRK